ncbi:type I restriction-modification system specificity subunit [Yimella radicis]
MRHARVRDLATQIRGVTFSKSDAVRQPQPGYLPVLTAGNIQEGRLVTDDVTFIPEARIRADQYIQDNDVVVCTSSGSLQVVGKAARSRGDYAGGFGAFLKVLRPGPEVDPGYFAHFFQTSAYRRNVSRLAAGANINNLKNEHLDDLLIPLPPLPEQRRIAAILDHADALRAKRRQVLAHLDSLTQAIFHEMFVPGKSPSKAMGDLVSDATIGLVRSAREVGPGMSINYMKMDSITRSGSFDRSALTRTEATTAEQQRYTARDGDLMLNTRNSRDLVGKSTIFRGPPALYNNNLMRLRFDRDVHPVFVHAYLWSPEGQQQLEKRKSGTTSVFAVYAKDLMTVYVPVPDARRQETFVARAEHILSQRSRVANRLADHDDLFASLQARAFRGEL